MLFVTQGHEKSISFEVFLKSYLLLSKADQSKIKYFVNINELQENCKLLNLSFRSEGNKYFIENDSINIVPIKKGNSPLTTLALEKALKTINEKDILITMPSSKDQIFFANKPCSGHTDYFRKKYENQNIAMLFKNNWENLLLLSDHIPLKKVSMELTSEYIENKVALTVNNYQKYFSNLEKVVFSGINPHAGENGLIGDEDKNISLVIDKLSKSFPNIFFEGPLAADSMHLNKDSSILKVFAYHDQGLTYFKSQYQFIGANVSLGLPFLRLSVDHGTAFELFGKNQANYMGCYDLFKMAIKYGDSYEH